MRIRYRVPFQRELIIADHWPISVMGGICHIVEDNGRAKALEISFQNQPVNYAPHVIETPDEKIKTHITDRDPLIGPIKEHLDNAMAYLECYHDVQLSVDEITVFYEAENSDEKERISISSISLGKHNRPFPLPFDMITRSIMAAETGEAPKFVAKLSVDARHAFSTRQYIDSFRYSFLLVESIYGEGKFRRAGLKAALKGNAEFRDIISVALTDNIKLPRAYESDTKALLDAAPSVDDVIDHLVDKRGLYFHGNVKRKDSWKPHDQREAQILAFFALSIVQSIGANFSDKLFSDEFAKRHYQDAIKSGAKMEFEVDFVFKEPDENFERKGQMKINTPGTKVSGKLANGVAEQFLRRFEDGAPTATLLSAHCTVRKSGEKVFDLNFHVNQT